MITIQVIYALPDRQEVTTLDLPESATVGDALKAYQEQRGPGVEGADAAVARYGRVVKQTDALADGDRLDILRPLSADPKELRRRRAAQQRERKKNPARP